MKKIFYHLFVLLLFTYTGCKKETTNTSDVKWGFAQGTVYALQAGKTISGARIYADAAGVRYETRSNTLGYFTLKLPAGHQALYIETGKGKLFQTRVEIHITENETTHMPATTTQLKQRGQIAYIPGIYDAIQLIITDSLGYAITAINPGQLNQLSSFDQYSAVFINCGAPDLTDSASYANLGQYVTNGGSLYVSDYAVSYLTGIHTGGCSRPLGFVEDSLLCSNKSGSVVTHNGAIVDTLFQQFMGKTNMSIYYNLPQWEVINSFNPSYWEQIVRLSGSIPLMLRKNNFTNNSSAGNGGNIYFTTFHNEPNGLINQDMQHMLEFVILNL